MGIVDTSAKSHMNGLPNLPIMRPRHIPKGACVQISPLLATDSAVPLRNPPPTNVAAKYQNLFSLCQLAEATVCTKKKNEIPLHEFGP